MQFLRRGFLGGILFLMGIIPSMAASPHKAMKIAPAYVTHAFRPYPFQTLKICAPLNVILTVSSAPPSVKLIGDPASVQAIKTTVTNGVLLMAVDPKHKFSPQSRLSAIINANPSLRWVQCEGSRGLTAKNLQGILSLEVAGSGTVTLVGAKKCGLDLRNLIVGGTNDVQVLRVNSRLLNICDAGSGKVSIRGHAVLQRLNYTGAGPLSIYWINSADVQVTGRGTGCIFLGGIANLLDVSLGGRACLNARYLHARRGFIKTDEAACVQVWTQCGLSTIATGSSVIQFYNDSGFVGAYSIPPAKVLRMTWLDPYHFPIPLEPC